MSISSYASDSSAARQPTAFASLLPVNLIPSVGHGSARRSRDVCDRARRRFVSSSRSFQFFTPNTNQ
eukprot:scaffold11404_cov90-Isochrysis_galbana.AAC.1